MTSLGNLLWIVGIGAVFFLMMRKGGGCCGGGHNDDQEVRRKELSGHNQSDANEKPRGGCCG
jgi:hypothetical protein